MAKQPKSLNKILATSAGAAVVAGALAPAAVSAAAADDFTDVTEETRHYEAIDALYSKGIVNGFGDGTFGPDEYLKRSEAVEMIFAAGDFEEDDSVDYDFTDVPTRISAMVDALAEEGVISGFSDSQFGPDAMLQREEMAKILVEAFDYDLEGAEESDFSDRGQTTLYPYIDVVAQEGIAAGYENGEFGVGDNILRKDFAAMLFRAMDNVTPPSSVEALGGTVEDVLGINWVVDIQLDNLEDATADSTVTLNVDGETIELMYNEDNDSFRNAEVSKDFSEEELLAATVEVKNEEPPVGGEPEELGLVTDIEGSVVSNALVYQVVNLPLESVEGATSESMVSIELEDGTTYDLTYGEDNGNEFFRNAEISTNVSLDELNNATVWLSN